MKIAIVIPAFNAAPFIEETLRSVLSQTYDDLEILLVDDGSSDETLTIASRQLEACHAPWKILSQQHQGVSAARNLGWRSTNAPWVQFLDADDLLAPDKLDHQLRAYLGADRPAAIISSPWQEFTVTGQGRRHGRFVGCDTLRRRPSELQVMAASSALHLGQSLFQREWIDRVGGFNPSLIVDEDLDFYLKLARAGADQFTVPGTDPRFFWRQHLQKRLGVTGASRYNAIDVSNQFIGNVNRIIQADRGELTQLSAFERDCLMQRCSSYLRLLYRYDRESFGRRINHFEGIFGSFLPTDPSYLRLLSRLIGFTHAENVAQVYRSGKKVIGLYSD